MRQRAARIKHPLPAGLTEEDWDISATIRDLRRLDPLLDRAASLNGHRPSILLDIGCGIGGLTRYVAERLSIPETIGIDRDEDRLRRAAERRVRPLQLNLNEDAFPIDDSSIDMAISFGVFEHVIWYDNIIGETARVLRDGAPFVVSMPNLGSFVNRFALLLGYQPRDVEVSREISAGIMPIYRRVGRRRARPGAHLHSATLRSMRELLYHFQFDVVAKTGFSPNFGLRMLPLADAIFEPFPSLSRRFSLLAQRRRRL